ncbi:MAG: hypothetical protein BRD55_05020 [Bacteroidetes bacterium SW_9_63_38]|nr:MAG: hypothetical protein BRD55_05020 [Bacteroidetes bacterium SW_9_63_38]
MGKKEWDRTVSKRFEARFKVARERLEASALLLGEGFPADAASRAYYGVYEAARVLLASEDVRPATHKGIENQLGHRFRGAPIDLQIFSRLRTDRQRCDYELDRPDPSRVSAHLDDARAFIKQAEQLVEPAR